MSIPGRERGVLSARVADAGGSKIPVPAREHGEERGGRRVSAASWAGRHRQDGECSTCGSWSFWRGLEGVSWCRAEHEEAASSRPQAAIPGPGGGTRLGRSLALPRWEGALLPPPCGASKTGQAPLLKEADQNILSVLPCLLLLRVLCVSVARPVVPRATPRDALGGLQGAGPVNRRARGRGHREVLPPPSGAGGAGCVLDPTVCFAAPWAIFRRPLRGLGSGLPPGTGASVHIPLISGFWLA